jgi:hypothetical protein
VTSALTLICPRRERNRIHSPWVTPISRAVSGEIYPNCGRASRRAGNNIVRPLSEIRPRYSLNDVRFSGATCMVVSTALLKSEALLYLTIFVRYTRHESLWVVRLKKIPYEFRGIGANYYWDYTSTYHLKIGAIHAGNIEESTRSISLAE